MLVVAAAQTGRIQSCKPKASVAIGTQSNPLCASAGGDGGSGPREHDDLERWCGGRALPWHRADFGFFGAHALSRCARDARMDSCGPLLATHFLLEKQVEGRASLLDHLVGARDNRGGNLQAECFRGLEVDHQVELSRLQHRQVGRLRAFENPTDIDAGLAPGGDKARSVVLRQPDRSAMSAHCPVSGHDRAIYDAHCSSGVTIGTRACTATMTLPRVSASSRLESCASRTGSASHRAMRAATDGGVSIEPRFQAAPGLAWSF